MSERISRLLAMGRLWLIAVLVGAASSAAAQVSTLPFDLLKVLNAAYYPLQIMAYCYKEVSQNRDFQSAGAEWNTRNADLLTKLEAMAKEQHISNDLRVQSDRDTLAAIEKVVGSQSDKIAYCKLIRSLVDGGGYDLTIRKDIQQQMKRIFPQ